MQGILNLNACITYPEKDDRYVTKNSAGFHEHMGYKPVGIFHEIGYKFGNWYDMIWMEKMTGPHSGNISPMIPFPEIKAKVEAFLKHPEHL